MNALEGIGAYLSLSNSDSAPFEQRFVVLLHYDTDHCGAHGRRLHATHDLFDAIAFAQRYTQENGIERIQIDGFMESP